LKNKLANYLLGNCCLSGLPYFCTWECRAYACWFRFLLIDPCETVVSYMRHYLTWRVLPRNQFLTSRPVNLLHIMS